MTRNAESRLRVYNTLTRSLDEFRPIHPGRVNMFVCGPTVYDSSHIGHAKTYVDYDIIARYLRRIGYSVFFVLNITDIDDRIINRARETGEDPLRLSSRYAQAFYKDMKDLRVESINLYAKASDYIPEIIDQVRSLIDKGIGYKIPGGVYYDTSKFPEYGKLSRQNLEQLTVHRIDPDPDKRNPSDFVIWKSQKLGEIFWDSPWGKGRPGWHIEDTAITLTHFGPTYDIHGGGSALRVLYASTHYRSPLDFTEEALTQAGSLARRFRRAYDQLERVGTDSLKPKARDTEAIKTTEGIEREFFAAMDDDFNTPGALAAYTRLVGMAEEHLRSPNPRSAMVLLETMKDLGSILGILEAESVPRANFSQLVELLVSLRADLRAKRDYSLTDRIRDQMTRLGVTVEDEK